MNNNPINFSDLFDFNDKSGIEEGIRLIKQLYNEYRKFNKQVTDANLQRYTEMQEQLAKANADLLETVKKLNAANKSNQQALVDSLKAAEQNHASIQKLNEAKRDTAKADKVVNDGYKSMAQQLRELRKEYEKAFTANDAKKMAEISARAKDLNNSISTVNKALKGSRESFKAASGSYDELNQRTIQLIKDLKAMPNAFDPANKKARELQQEIFRNTQALKDFDRALNQNFRNVGNYRSAFDGIGQGITGFVTRIVSMYSGFEAIRFAFDQNRELTKNLSDLQRISGLTADEAWNLVDAFKNLNTPTTTAGLVNIATIGAQLGVAKEDLAGFTQAIDQLAVVMQREIPGGAEQVADSLGKINNIFRVTETESVDVGTALSKTGSAILGLGQAGLATGDYLTDFTLRVGGVAKQFEISLPIILAYGAVLQEAGVTSEVAGTSFSKFLSLMFTKTDKYFAIAQLGDATLTLEKFKDLLNTDVNEAIQVFFNGLRNAGKENTEFAEMMKEIGAREGRFSNALLSMAKSQDVLNKRIETSNTLFREGSLAAEQFEKQNDNLDASWNKLIKSLSDTSTGPGVATFFKAIVDGAGDAVGALNRLIAAFGDWDKFFIRLGLNSALGIQNGNSFGDALLNQADGIGRVMKEFNALENRQQKLAYEQAQTRLRDEAYDTYMANKTKKNYEQLEFYQKTLTEMRKALAVKTQTQNQDTKAIQDNTDASIKSIAELRKAIAELEKTEGSTDKNSDVYKRLQSYREQLKDLNKQAKGARESLRIITELDRMRASMEAERKNFELDIALGRDIDPERLEKYRSQLEKLNKAAEKLKSLTLSSNQIKLDNIVIERASLDVQLAERIISQEEYNRQVDALELRRLTTEQENYEKGTKDFEERERQKLIIRQRISDELVKAQAQRLRRENIEEETALNYNKIGVRDTDINNLSNSERADLEYNERLENEYRERKYARDMAALNLEQSLYKQGSDEYLEIERQKSEVYKQEQERRTKFAQTEEQRRLDVMRQAFNQMQQMTSQLSSILGNDTANLFSSIVDGIQGMAENGFISIEQSADIARNAFSTLGSALNAASNARISKLQKEKEKELKIAGDNAQAREVIEQKYQARVAAEKRKQAVADKAVALMNIAINTATAITKVLAQTGIAAPFIIPTIAALGAAQAAIVVTRPIPEFYKGTRNAPEGVAMVGERGAELIEENGKFRLTGDKPEYTYLKKGAKVYTHEETKKILNYENVKNIKNYDNALGALLKGTNVVTESQFMQTQKVVSAIMNTALSGDVIHSAVREALEGMPINQMNWDEKGYTLAQLTKHSRIIQRNKRTKLGGNG